MCETYCAGPGLKNGFTIWERILWRVLCFGLIGVAIAGIASRSLLGAVVYALLAGVGLLGLAMPRLCSHCPYPSQYSVCLFLPHRLMSKWFPFRGVRMATKDRRVVLLVTLGLVALPHLWLLQAPMWLGLFWAMALPVAIAFPFYYCLRCRHFGCPMNRVTRARRAGA